jgi:hypothetical protein
MNKGRVRPGRTGTGPHPSLLVHFKFHLVIWLSDKQRSSVVDRMLNRRAAEKSARVYLRPRLLAGLLFFTDGFAFVSVRFAGLAGCAVVSGS